jgi:DNA-binding NtrC family response regulator
MSRLLIVDDDRSIRRTLEKFFQGEGYEVSTAGDGVEGLAAAAEADVVLLDLGLPGKDGLEVLAGLSQRAPAPAVIVITARDDMRSTVKAIQLGAHDYLVKPLDIERLRLTVRRAAEARAAQGSLRQIVADTASGRQVGDIVGRSQAIREVFKTIAVVSQSRATALVLGESGTGKELVSRAIHYAGEGHERPFVAVNCSAFVSELLESELFGHVRGAFTGAVADKPGRFELAGDGTLFLDEVAEIPIELQAKLLRVLQERTFERVGGVRPIALRARIIAATHRDLAAEVRAGRFREDLYYRLKVVEITLPPLRERREDIPPLVEALLGKLCRELHKPLRYLGEGVMERLMAYDWPGNVRELENALTRAAVLAKDGVLTAELLPLGAPRPAAKAEAPEEAAEALLPLAAIERRHIERVLAHVGWNKRRACAVLDISRPTLDRKIEEYGIERPE